MPSRHEIIITAADILRQHGVRLEPELTEVRQLVPDGSTRLFLRLHQGATRVVCVLPPNGEQMGMAEARSVDAIGRHLYRRGVPVPFVYGLAAETGMVVCEDLGTQRLHDLLDREQGMTPRLIGLYEQAVRQLAHMQVEGARAFDPSWCWDTPIYDQQVMLEKEAGYFLGAFCGDFLDLPVDQEPVLVECRRLAEAAAKAPAHFFLHRDFQSRNLMVTGEGDIRIIDFQGGRLGPLAYDLASLLIDPYAHLENEVQDHLLEVYLERLVSLCSYDRQQFRNELFLLSVLRNLQILGAFAFLSAVRGKIFFRQYLQPALTSLVALLEKAPPGEYAALHILTRQCCQKLLSRL